MKVKYIANDGEEFNNKKQCMATVFFQLVYIKQKCECAFNVEVLTPSERKRYIRWRDRYFCDKEGNEIK